MSFQQQKQKQQQRDRSRDKNRNKYSTLREHKASWKRAQDLPVFLDASSSVSASTFGSRRLPEIKALWNKNKRNTLIIPSEEPLLSSGGKTSKRHLRRRVTSHNPRKRHRYPSGRYVIGESREATVSPQLKPNDEMIASKTNHPPSRRKRRKYKAELHLAHESWWKGPLRTNIEETIVFSENSSNEIIEQIDKPVIKDQTTSITRKEKSSKWLTTHIWHAKRFHMADLWGWRIPIVHTNRGPKAALRLIGEEGKTTLQDVTWKMAQPIVLRFHEINGSASFVFKGKDHMPKFKLLEDNIQTCIRRLCPEFQMCIQPSSSSSATARKDELQTNNGSFYALDEFPRNALGPVTWLISKRRPLVGNQQNHCNNLTTASASESSSSYYHIIFWTHPAIQTAVWKEFVSLKQSSDGQTEKNNFFLSLQNGFYSTSNAKTRGDQRNESIACFKLRGISSTKAIRSIVLPSIASQSTITSRLLVDDHLHSKIPSGTAISIYISTTNDRNNVEIDEGHKVAATTNDDDPWIQGHRALLISRCVDDPNNRAQNAPAMGWDIYCDAIVAKDIFLKLGLGQVCVIGIVEEAYLNLECDLPIANVFPRDFPETEVGRKYWKARSDDDSDNSDIELNILRLCLEGGEGGGRVPVPVIKKRCKTPIFAGKENRSLSTKVSAKRLCEVQWDILNRCSTETNSEKDGNYHIGEENVVMMRGSFGEPLLQALSGSGRISEQASPKNEEKGKSRRPVKQPNEVRHVIPLTRDEAEMHIRSCNSLLQAMSLPAVITCHLQVVGAGSLKPGLPVYAANGNDSNHRLLGYVTAACFSVARGHGHGTAVVGASRLLQSVVEASSTVQRARTSLAIVRASGLKRVNVIVVVHEGRKCIKATLGLLL